MYYEDLWILASESEADFSRFAIAFLNHKLESHSEYSQAVMYGPWDSSVVRVSARWLDEREVIRWLYGLAQSYGFFLGLGEDAFWEKAQSLAFPRRGPRHGWYRRHGAKFREGLGFRYSGQPLKEAAPNEEWRRASGHYRDKARRGKGWLRAGIKKQAKKDFNSKLRALERQCLARGEWEKAPKRLRRPWMD
jgi:hypothetical protein